MTQSFEDILSMPIEDIKAPAAMPAGQYLAIIDGTGTEQAQDEPEKHRWVFRVKLLSALNVDHSELEEALDGRQLSEVPQNFTLWLNPKGLYRSKIFLQNHLDITMKDLRDGIRQAPGHEFIATVTHQPGRDGGIFTQISNTAHVGGAPRAA